MGQTMAAKILAIASGQEGLKVGDVVLAKVEMMTHLDTAPYIESFYKHGLKLWDPEKVIYCFDHSLQGDWRPNCATKIHPLIRQFAKDQGVPMENVFDLDRAGISHQIPSEHGFALPGTVCVGFDTQSSTMGAMNCFALPTLFGSTPILLTGDIWMVVPECIRINLTGELPIGVSGKDFVYRLMKDFGENVGGRVIEFAGPGIVALSMDARMAVANGSVQLGALTTIFPPDQVLEDYLKGRARKPYRVVEPDDDAEYAESFDYDLASTSPLISGPHDIDLIRPLTDIQGLEADVGYIGSCSSGRLDDLKLAADVLRGHKVKAGFRLFVTPISQETMREASRVGVLQVFLDAGAVVTNPGCGGCYVSNLSPLKLSDGERCISSSVETVRGRMGSQNSEVLLGNTAVVAASAIEGKITNPAKYLNKTEG